LNSNRPFFTARDVEITREAEHLLINRPRIRKLISMNALGSAQASLASLSSMDDPSVLRGQKPAAVAQQFEGLFLSMLVKQMRQSPMEGEGLFPGDSSDTYGGMFDTFMGQHLAETGGIGMSDSIQDAIEAQMGSKA